jgi:hypothetical protein
MNMNELFAEYDAAFNRASKEYQSWVANGGTYETFKGYRIDYNYFTERIGDVIQEEFKLTDAQRGYIMGEAYTRYHSGYSDMFWGAHGLAEFVTKFPKN